MFKNRKLEVRLVKDDASTNKVVTPDEQKLDAVDYALIAEEAATRLGKKLLIGVITTIVVVAVVGVLTNAADTALQNALETE